MKKSARRILTLVLSLVLVCMCAAYVLATADPENPIFETHGDTELVAYLQVNRYNSTSSIEFYPDGSEVQSAYIRTVYEIYNRREDDTSLPGTYFTTTGYTNTVDRNRGYISYEKAISSSTYYGISRATVTFYAKIVGTNTTCEFTPDPYTIHSGLFD